MGFESPESVLYDELADLYLVSNVNGGLADADGNGFISRLGPAYNVPIQVLDPRVVKFGIDVNF